MPKITVNGVSLAYEILGNGPALVLTPPGLGISKEIVRRLAEKLSSKYKVLIYDRRNSGASDVAFEGALGEPEIFADDLCALLERLEMAPVYVGGASGGSIVSLLVAHRHAEVVKGLLLESPPTDNLEVFENLAQARYIASAELAEVKGMQAVIEMPYWTESLERLELNPGHRKQLLSMDPIAFAATMRRLSAWFTSGRARFGGLTDEQLGGITTPALIVPGLEEPHPQHVAEELHDLLPKSELFSHQEVFSPAEIDQLLELAEHWTDGQHLAAYAPFYDSFMSQVEAQGSGG